MIHRRASFILNHIESQDYDKILITLENAINNNAIAIEEIIDIKTGDNVLHRLFQSGITAIQFDDFAQKFSYRASLKAENRVGLTPVDSLFTVGNVPLLNVLEGRRDINIKTHQSQFGNALHLAARKDNPIFIHFLLKKGVDHTQKNSSGHLPIDVARRYANFKVIEVLEFALENNFNPVVPLNNDREDFTP